MFDRGSRTTITESVADSVEELDDFTTDSCPNLARIGVWVLALRGTEEGV